MPTFAALRCCHVARTSPPGLPGADRLVESADDLLAKTRWDPSPPHVRTDERSEPWCDDRVGGYAR